MGQFNFLLSLYICLILSLSTYASAQLRQNYYANTCPDVENIVREAVSKRANQIPVTIPATIQLFFHDCFVSGCDASVMIASTPENKAEKDHPENKFLAGDGFDTVIKAKAAVDAVPGCKNKVSCADILALAARDAIVLANGPSYPVELGRLDGLSSTAASVNLPEPTFKVDELTDMFARKGLSQTDMIALSGAHTLGFSHCTRFLNRIFHFNSTNPVDPTMDLGYAKQLQAMCGSHPDPDQFVPLDPTTQETFDNAYFNNLLQHKGLFTSDQDLLSDARTNKTVMAWAKDAQSFNAAFVHAITKLGRVEVKTGKNGNIRFDCEKFN